MITKNQFELITALITPFTSDESIDYHAAEKLLELQINAGVGKIVIMGSTGEGHSLSDKERREFISFCKKIINKRSVLIAAINANITKNALEQVLESREADMLMIAAPYYIKPTENGLYQHFSKIAQSTELPIILYNIPGRTSVNMNPALISRLFSDHPNIIALKESSADLSHICKSIAAQREKVLCGDDEAILIFAAQGASGIVSVLSNLIPVEMTRLCQSLSDGDFSTARETYYRAIHPLLGEVFSTTNPIGIKIAMNNKHAFVGGMCRMPLC